MSTCGLKREGQEWAEHLVPDENLGELPSGESGESSPHVSWPAAVYSLDHICTCMFLLSWLFCHASILSYVYSVHERPFFFISLIPFSHAPFSHISILPHSIPTLHFLIPSPPILHSPILHSTSCRRGHRLTLSITSGPGSRLPRNCVHQLLREREQSLEMRMSNTIFMDEASQLLDWIRENLQLEAVVAPPPASRDEIQGYLYTLEVCCTFTPFVHYCKLRTSV